MFPSCHLGLRLGGKSGVEGRLRVWRKSSGRRDSAEASVLLLGLAARNDAEWVFSQTSWIVVSSLRSQWTAEAPGERHSVRKHCRDNGRVTVTVSDHKGKPKTEGEKGTSLYQLKTTARPHPHLSLSISFPPILLMSYSTVALTYHII